MAGIFESVTRVAIEEILLNHAKEAKYGYLLPKEALNDLRDEIYNLLVTSRDLKAAGDKLIKEGIGAMAKPQAR